MNITESDFKRLSEIRVEHSKQSKKDGFGIFTLLKNGQKAITRVSKDRNGLLPLERGYIEDIKEAKNCNYNDPCLEVWDE